MTKILTLSQLKAAGACAGALRRFTAAFGESTPVTPALACKHADQFSWNWAADNLLSAPAQAAYDRATERAWAAYDRAAAPARAKYAVAAARAWAAYDRAAAPARVKYAAAAPALALLNSPRVSGTASPARAYGPSMIKTASARRSSMIETASTPGPSMIGPSPPREPSAIKPSRERGYAIHKGGGIMTKILALSQLKAAGACAGALRRFTAAFGKSVQVTPSLAGKYADQFSWDWAADNLLPAPARAAYDRATERAWAEYETAAAPARVKYAAATAAARVKYAAAAAPALALLNSPRVSGTASPARTYGLNMIGTVSAR